MKIGFCFLTYSNISFESIWEAYFRDIPLSKYHIIIHSKNPKECKSSLKNVYIIKKPVETKYADISLVKATILMFKYAVKIKCDYMILLSGDCLPLTSFKKMKPKFSSSMFVIQNKRLLEKKSISFNKRNYSRLSSTLKEKISFEKFEKQNMFFGITKKDFETILNSNLLYHFSRLYAPDEYFFINSLIINKKLLKSQNIMLANTDNDRKTKSQVWQLTKRDIDQFSLKYLFIRKIKSLSKETSKYLIKKIDRSITVVPVAVSATSKPHPASLSTKKTK